MRQSLHKQTRLRAAFVFCAALIYFSAYAAESETTVEVSDQPKAATENETQTDAERAQTNEAEDSDKVKPETPTVAAIDIDELIARLKKTNALGLFTKLALKGDIEDIIDSVDKYRRKEQAVEKLVKVRSQFEGLVLKTVTLLDEKDPKLAKDIYLAREYVWISIVETKT